MIGKRQKIFPGQSGPVTDGPIRVQPGTQVRLVDLPAHPGLEGRMATVVSVDENREFVDVLITSTKVNKRVCHPNFVLSYSVVGENR